MNLNTLNWSDLLTVSALNPVPNTKEKQSDTKKYIEAYPPRIYRQCKLSLETMTKLKIKTNEPILIRSASEKGSLVAGVVWPIFDLSVDDIRLSSYLLNNCDVCNGEKVQIAKWFPDSIASLTLSPLFLDGLEELRQEDCVPLITQLLSSLEFLCQNNIVDLNIGGRPVRFRIIDIECEARAGIFKPEITKIKFDFKIKIHRDAFVETSKDEYERIGGLQQQIAEIKAVMELPLRLSTTHAHYGLKPPRGLLLYGPPGTGKTLLARTAAESIGATPLLVAAPELISRYVGETEQKIQEIFAKAKESQPSVICIDEIDALCPRRDKSQSDQEKRAVATLLTLMDGITDTSHQTLVIATTNRPEAIDPALRRPGRFDTEIEVGIPDPEARLDILNKLLAKTPKQISQQALEKLARNAHGYVGADIASLVREAGLVAIRRHIRSYGDKGNVMISEEDFEQAFLRVQPSAMREVAVEVPKVLWAEIGGNSVIRQKLREAVEWPLTRPELFTRFSIRPPRGILLYGPPGCSKTLMAKALATEAQVNFLLVKGPELYNQWVGESEKAVREIFRKARAAAPAIIFLDEVDALTVKRSGATSGVSDRVLAQFLVEMDGIDANINTAVTVVGATNRPDIIDPALLRPGRFDRILYVGAPDLSARKEILAIQADKMPFDSQVSLDWLADETKGCSGAEIVGLCQDAALAALDRDRFTTMIHVDDFQTCISRGLTKRITDEMLQFYEQFRLKAKIPSI